MITKTTITFFLLGVIVALFFTHAYFVYQIKKQTIQNTNNIGQIVNYLNSQIPK